jgi:hypothetical protein
MSSDQIQDSFLNPHTVYVWPGTARIFSVVWGGSDALSLPTHICYQSGDDVSATILAGTTTLSGRIQTSKTASAWTAGETYTMYFGVTKGSEIVIKALRVICGEYGVGW